MICLASAVVKERMLRTIIMSDFVKVRQLIEDQKSISNSLAVFVSVVEGFKHDWGKKYLPV